MRTSTPLDRAVAGVASVLRVVRRRGRVATAVAISVVALAAVARAVTPKTWHAEVELLAQRAPIMPALGNPGRTVPPDADAPTRAAAETILSQQNLAALVKRTDLVRTWERTRSPLGRARDALARLAGRRRTEEEKADALVYLLRDRLYVAAGPMTVTIGIDWPDGPTAYRLVQVAEQEFLEKRRSQETSIISDAVTILDRRAAEAERETLAAFDALRVAEAGPEPQPSATRGAPRASPPRRRSVPRDPEIARLQSVISAKQLVVQQAEEARQRQVAEAESRLAEISTVLAEQHPDMKDARRTVAALRQPAASTLALRAEVDALQRELARRVAEWRAARAAAAAEAKKAGLARRDPPAAPPRERDPGDASARYARDRLRAAASTDATLAQRYVDTRVELDFASAAFKYRYAVLRPAMLPREPVTPRSWVLLVGTIVLSVALAVFAAMALDRRDVPAAPSRLRRVRRTLPVLGVVAAVALPTIAALVSTAIPAVGVAPPRWPDSPAWALGPAALAVIAWAIWTLPLRHTAIPLVFVMLAIDPRGAADGGKWEAPWAGVGYLLNTNLNMSIPLKALRFTGVDALVLAMVAVIVWRRATGSRVDREGAVEVPWPLHAATLASAGTLLVLVAYGWSRGGDVLQTLWQTHQFAILPAVFFVLLSAVRGPGDFRALGTAIVAAAVVKAIQATYVRYTIGLDHQVLGTATTHADSMLFVGAAVVLVALLFECRTRRALAWCAVLVPILALGMRANQRRLAWVELAAALAIVFALSPWTRFKRSMARAAAVLLPVFAIYVVAGWDAQSSAFFGPAVKIRSIVDSKYDRSTEERDVENFNLVSNLLARPVLGTGFGHEYVQYVQPDDISWIFAQWRYIPHNSVLGLLAFCGIVGFTGLWIVLPVAVFFAARGHRFARDPVHRAAALAAIGAILVYMIQCYGDMGFTEWHGVFLVAAALAIAAKLPVPSGAWPARSRTRAAPAGQGAVAVASRLSRNLGTR